MGLKHANFCEEMVINIGLKSSFSDKKILSHDGGDLEVFRSKQVFADM